VYSSIGDRINLEYDSYIYIKIRIGSNRDTCKASVSTDTGTNWCFNDSKNCFFIDPLTC